MNEYEIWYNKGYEAGFSEAVKPKPMEEISSLDMDLLTILARIYQAQHLIRNIDPMAERILTCDAPRLAGHITQSGMEWCERTDLDTAFPEWLRGLRK